MRAPISNVWWSCSLGFLQVRVWEELLAAGLPPSAARAALLLRAKASASQQAVGEFRLDLQSGAGVLASSCARCTRFARLYPSSAGLLCLLHTWRNLCIAPRDVHVSCIVPAAPAVHSPSLSLLHLLSTFLCGRD